MKTLLIRTLSGAVFVAVIVAAILLSGLVQLNVFLLFAMIAVYEYASLLKTKGLSLSKYFYFVSIVFYIVLAYPQLWQIFPSSLLLLFLLLLLLLFGVIELFRKQQDAFATMAYSVLGLIWIVVPFALVNQFSTFFQQQAAPLLLLTFVFIWASDTFAYCVGSLIGKHRLFERISPKKSWEGLLAAFILTIALSYLIAILFPQLTLTIWQMMFMAAIVVVVGVLGDLVESLFKRELGVKDSGRFLPGHGGILDRFDSFLLVLPFVLFYLITILS